MPMPSSAASVCGTTNLRIAEHWRVGLLSAANVKGRLFFTGPTTVGNFDSNAREFPVTVHTQKFLTPEELDSLVEFAVTSPAPNIPAAHLTRLVVLGSVAVTRKA